jgi:endonuclease G, mitochondrial
MTFDGYLTTTDIQELTESAVAGELFETDRAVLLSGIPGAFVAGLKLRPSPIDQFMLDLAVLNRVERLANGVVPIEVLLDNARFRLRIEERPESQVFAEKFNLVHNTASGVPTLPEPSQLPEITHNERIIGTDETLDLAFLSGGLGMAAAVARINVPRFESRVQIMAAVGGPWVLRGTAWLVAPGMAITNHHVINARLSDEPDASAADLALQAKGATLEFDVDTKDATPTRVTVAKLLAASKGLDYALLDLTGAPGRLVPRLIPKAVVLEPTTRMAVNIVQHPRGEYKQVAFRNNLVTFADATTMRYVTDTDYGSSGSPVCDDAWRVVALHRGARSAPEANYQGKTGAFVNYGSQIQAVLEDVRAHDSTIADRIVAGQPV